jgi:DUF4097 and DUF4098 domain-containing protein YvlB
MLGLWRSHGGVRAGLSRVVQGAGDNSQGVTGDEIRKSFDLKPGALVQVQGINGKVDIQTAADTKTTEVYVKRTGDDPSSLRRRDIIIEQTSEGLLVRSKQNHTGLWDHLFGKDPKEEVTIKASRDIALTLKGINGHVNAGDITGALEVRGVNGRVETATTGQSVEVSGINGSISIGLKQLGEHGARFSGINGGVEIRLSVGLNADLRARGMNGRVVSEVSDVTVERENAWSNYSSQIGKGGPLIEISGINGNVRLTRGEGAAAAPSADSKSSDKSDRASAAKASN